MKFEVWLLYPGSGDPPGEGVEPFEIKVASYDTGNEANDFIEKRYRDGRYHTETYEIRNS